MKEHIIDTLTETINREWGKLHATNVFDPRSIAERCFLDLFEEKGPVIQLWVTRLTYMQQAVLLACVRGPDNTEKYHACKYLVRWYRRCILLSSMDGEVIDNPEDPRGGSFTGPSILDLDIDDLPSTPWYLRKNMKEVIDKYIQSLDVLPHHYQMHFLHGAEIIGYKHPDATIAGWWRDLYVRLVRDMHLRPESEEAMDERLGDNRAGWEKHADEATRD